ncbi:MAG: DUF438 domain-containing protein [Promethearchaeota archaeon]
MDRKEILKKLIKDLHAGVEPEVVKEKLKQELVTLSAVELAQIEQELIESNELSIEEVTAFCNIHSAAVRDGLKSLENPEIIPGHPIHTYKIENEKFKEITAKLRNGFEKTAFAELKKVNIHYTRIENQLFPLLEKRGFAGPSTVMWSKHDEIRQLLKDVESGQEKSLPSLLDEVDEMIFKEERILFPTALEKLTSEDWLKVRLGEEEIGYCWEKPEDTWLNLMEDKITPKDVHALDHETSDGKIKAGDVNLKGIIKLDTGELSAEIINIALKTMPVDVTIIDENDKVSYYTNSTHRIFPRSPGIIGREVQKCHPPKSVHVVNKILDAFKNGTKDQADFYLTVDDHFIYISYHALRDERGNYKGTMEFSQDLTELRKLKGEKRLLDWKD